MINLNLEINKTILDFSDNAKQNCISDINNYFVNGDWCKNVPLYQTWPVLFNRTETHWVELKTKITEQVKTKCEISNLKPEAWAYVCFVGKTQSYNNQYGWHSHDFSNAVYSAIFYLNFEEGFDATEFMDLNGEVYRPKLQENMLIYFDSKVVHRPAIWNTNNHKQNRYVVSIDYRK